MNNDESDTEPEFEPEFEPDLTLKTLKQRNNFVVYTAQNIVRNLLREWEWTVIANIDTAISRSISLWSIINPRLRACAAEGYCSRSVCACVCVCVCVCACVLPSVCPPFFSVTAATPSVKRGHIIK